MPKKPDDEHEIDPDPVGYRRPPRKHQFKPGKSGNPRGRPRKAPTLHDVLLREASRPIKIKTPNGIMSKPAIEVVMRGLFDEAIKGDLASRRLLLLHLANAANKDEDTQTSDQPLTPDISDEAFQRMLSRFTDFGEATK